MAGLRAGFLCAALCLYGQEPAAPLRISVTLVQVDAVVTGPGGRQVTDLGKDDFEVFEDGKPRTVTYFSYVRTGGGTQPAGSQQKAISAVPGFARYNTVTRTIALLVDDLKMSFDGINHTRETLKKFVDQQMSPGDLVAVVTTSGGISALQQFTTDKRMLHAAIDRIRFRLDGGGQRGAVIAIGQDTGDSTLGQLLNRKFVVGTLGTIRYITEGMKDMPGRKSLILLSDGFPIYRRKIEPPVSVDEVQRVSDRANRSAVVIYGLDMRGLDYPGLQAQDDVANLESEQVVQALYDRKVKFNDNKQGLQFLAQETGGLAQFDDNDFNGGLSQMLEQQAGYYLLAFQPGEADAVRMSREGKYHRLTVRVRRSGLRVRYRKGYMGESADTETPPQTPAQRLLAALNSPFGGTGLRLRFTPGFVMGEKGQPAIRVLLHVEASELSFSPPGADGQRVAKLHVIAVAEGEATAVGGTTERAYTLKSKVDPSGKPLITGFVYAFQHEVKKPGPYNMRIAVLDDLSGKIGSASSFIDVPDVSKRSLAISGITMQDGDWRTGNVDAEGPEADMTPAIRVFRYRQPFSYGVIVYNARLDEQTRQPRIQLQARLIRDDEVVWEGKRFPVVVKPGVDPRRIPAGGVMTLGEQTIPGTYFLELQAIDPASDKPITSQWTDFEIH